MSADSYLLGARDPLGGQIQGFDIDFVKAMAKAILGDEKRYQLVVITAAQRIPALQSGQVDLVARNMTMTCDRWKQIAFSSEYYRAGQKIMVRAESKATTLADLAGQRVCAPNGTSSMDNLRARQPDAVAVGSDSHTGCLVLFQQGKVDAITGDDTVLAGLAAQDPYAVVPEQTGVHRRAVRAGHEREERRPRAVRQRAPGADARGRRVEDDLRPVVRGAARPRTQPAAGRLRTDGMTRVTGPTTAHHVPAGVPAPPAPGRLGEALEPEAALTYLTALGDWLAARRAELDALDREVLASAEPVRLTGDVTLAMALWQAVADREAQLRAVWDSGRVGRDERERMATLVWGRRDTRGPGGAGAAGSPLALSVPEACRLNDAVVGELRERLGLDPSGAQTNARVAALRAQLERLRDQTALEPAGPPRLRAVQHVAALAARLDAAVDKAGRGGDVGGILGPVEVEAATFERDLIVGGARRREAGALVARVRGAADGPPAPGRRAARPGRAVRGDGRGRAALRRAGRRRAGAAAEHGGRDHRVRGPAGPRRPRAGRRRTGVRAGAAGPRRPRGPAGGAAGARRGDRARRRARPGARVRDGPGGAGRAALPAGARRAAGDPVRDVPGGPPE